MCDWETPSDLWVKSLKCEPNVSRQMSNVSSEREREVGETSGGGDMAKWESSTRIQNSTIKAVYSALLRLFRFIFSKKMFF